MIALLILGWVLLQMGAPTSVWVLYVMVLCVKTFNVAQAVTLLVNKLIRKLKERNGK